MGRMIVFRDENEHEELMHLLRKGKEMMERACELLDRNTEMNERDSYRRNYREDYDHRMSGGRYGYRNYDDDYRR